MTPRTCEICHIRLSDQPDDPFICDLCREEHKERIFEFEHALFEQGRNLVDVDTSFYYKHHSQVDHVFSVSKNGFVMTNDGGECMFWVCVADPNTLHPYQRPVNRHDIFRDSELTDSGAWGPYTYGGAVAVKYYLTRMNRKPERVYEIYDFTGFLVTANNVRKYDMSYEEILQLIHGGKIKYVYFSVDADRRAFHFKRDDSFVTSFMGQTYGYAVISKLLSDKHIIWNETYQVYVTRYFDPKSPPRKQLPQYPKRYPLPVDT